jgi:hypothetical protein
MAPRPEISEVPQSSPDAESNFITALQGGPNGSPGVTVPTRLFNPPPEPQGYMEEEPRQGKILVLSHVKEDAEEVGDTDSVCSAAECEELKSAMDSAFWDRVRRVLVKNEDERKGELDYTNCCENSELTGTH